VTPLKELLAQYSRERGGSLEETAQGVRELSLMFNGITPHRPGYLSVHRLRRAYVRYYLPTNVPKVAHVLSELKTYAPWGSRPRVLDFGCGPGTASIALLELGAAADLTLVDVVDEALDDAAFFTRSLGARPRLLHEPPAEKFDLILAANVFSETAPDLGTLLAERGHLVVIEPALKASTQRLMEWRDRQVEQGYTIAAPCLGPPRCPMRAHPELWCHQEIPWPRPAFIAEVDRRVGLAKETLKYSYIVATRGGRTLADLPGDVRLVSNLHREKGKAWAWVCGRQGPLCRAEVLTRHRSEATSAFFRAVRGDRLRMNVEGETCRSEGPIEKVL
jgi:ribosomal protein RSM22 (predicted rRNA methylase)